ncbi:MAG: hypothetical protein V4573_07870 [Pseudomonadota bacterium]
MSLFKGLFPSTKSPRSNSPERQEHARGGPETAPVKMNLEERMAFRRELLFENVRTTLSSYFIDARSYHFKVMRTDKRGHCYVVMLDMPPAFMLGEQGQHARLAEIAAALTKNAQTRYGLIIGGVYWRVDESLAATSTERARPTATPSFASSQPGPELTNIEKYERATAEELAAFEAAWQRDSDIQIGDRTYSSDLAPLGDDPPR